MGARRLPKPLTARAMVRASAAARARASAAAPWPEMRPVTHDRWTVAGSQDRLGRRILGTGYSLCCAIEPLIWLTLMHVFLSHIFLIR